MARPVLCDVGPPCCRLCHVGPPCCRLCDVGPCSLCVPQLERATVIVDERGKSTGEGVIEFAKKPCAQACLNKCTENSFFITE